MPKVLYLTRLFVDFLCLIKHEFQLAYAIVIILVLCIMVEYTSALCHLLNGVGLDEQHLYIKFFVYLSNFEIRVN